jgi:hypothetical protein
VQVLHTLLLSLSLSVAFYGSITISVVQKRFPASTGAISPGCRADADQEESAIPAGIRYQSVNNAFGLRVADCCEVQHLLP